MDVQPGLRNTDFQQYSDYLHFTEEETIPCYSNYSLSFSVLIYHPLLQFFGECPARLQLGYGDKRWTVRALLG